MTTTSHPQGSYDESPPGGPGEAEAVFGGPGQVGPWDLTKLKRSDRRMIERAVANPRKFKLSNELMEALPAALGRARVRADQKKNDREVVNVSGAIAKLADYNLEVDKYEATLERWESEAEESPVKPEASQPVTIEANPKARREMLLDPAETMRLIHADPKLAKIADEVNIREASARAAAK